MPRWVRWWYHVPFVDRYAHVWMWDHGGWQIVRRSFDGPGGPAHDREPRRPSSEPPGLRRALEPDAEARRVGLSAVQEDLTARRAVED